MTPGPVWMERRSRPDGYEAEIDVAFVDPANLPPAHSANGWRVVEAEPLWAAQSALYLAGRDATRQDQAARKR